VSVVELVLNGKRAAVGDFEVVRALPQVARRLVGPFCFLDHLGPAELVAREGGGVGPHPHIGLATVTYLFEGDTLHRDSLGTVQRIRPGDVNWMSAGRGIVHSERTPPERVGQRVRTHGLQLWVALPADQEESAPSFQHADRDALPFVEAGGVALRLVLGAWKALRSPIQVASPTLFAVAQLEPGATLEVPAEATERALYVVSGAVGLDGASLEAHQLAVLTPGAVASVSALTPSTLALIGGEPLDGPRFMLWNWVSSRKERLEQARLDWKEGRLPLIPGDSDERIPGPGE